MHGLEITSSGDGRRNLRRLGDMGPTNWGQEGTLWHKDEIKRSGKGKEEDLGK